MRWEGRRESDNVQDMRGVSPRMAVAGGGIGTILIMLLAMLFGADPRALLRVQQQIGGAAAPAAGQQAPGPDDERSRFVKVVLADTEDVWNKLLPDQLGVRYTDPTLVLFSQAVQSGCGPASAGMGPFYCPADQKLYIDLDFYDELRDKFGADGDFAQAYVIAHEVGHHVQNLLGYSDRVQRARARQTEEQANALSVRLELQADYLAGCWAHHGQREKRFLDPGDVEEALNCAKAIGDDAIQKRMQGYVVPDSFTHGSSQQRIAAFRQGLETGDVSKPTLEAFFQ